MVSWKSFVSVFGDALCLQGPKKLLQAAGLQEQSLQQGSGLEEQHKVLSTQPGV